MTIKYLLIYPIIFMSLLFGYENKFSFLDTSEGKRIVLEQNLVSKEVFDGYTRIATIGNGHTTEIGAPELPRFTTYYQLDPMKIYEFDIEVLESYIVEDIDILPHQGMEKWEVDFIVSKNQEIYNSYKPFPQNNLFVSNRSQGRGIEFVEISVIPYKYYPKYKRLEVYTSVNINVIESYSNVENKLRQPKRSRIFDELYKDLIVNFEYSNRPDDYQSSAILYICGGNSIDNSYVQNLIRWRHKQGYIVYAVSESEVGGNSADSDEIRDYIKSAYESWENPPEIIGLIGDTGGNYSLPKNNHSWGGYQGPTDFEYTQLDESGDLIPEVIIGRISGESSSDIENIINKTIQYEKATYLDDRIFKSAGLAGDPDESGNSTIFTNQYIENIMINHGMNNVQTDFDGSGVQTFMEQQFNRGILYYNYRGWIGGYGSYPTNAINNGFETPFVTTITCGTGDFDGTSSSEEFVRLGSVNNPKGAIGSVGMATIGTHTAYNNIVNMGIYDGIFSKDLWYAGAANTNGDLSLIATYPNPNSAVSAAEAFTKWSNLIGDPALHLWTATPNNFDITHPESIILGTTTLDFNVIDVNGEPIENANVTLLMDDDVIFSTGITDANGQITLSWDNVELGQIELTIIKRNFRPYEGIIEIVSEEGAAAIALNNPEIFVESGKEVELDINMYNYADYSANNVIVDIFSSSENITIFDNEINLGNITPNQDFSFKSRIYIHGTAFDLETIEIELEITDADGNVWNNLLILNVLGPYLDIVNYFGEIFPGSSTNLILDVINYGSKKATDYKIELVSIQDVLSINQKSDVITELFSGENIYLNNYELTFDSNIINGTILPLEIIMISEDGYFRSETINLTVGQVRESDPLGPDLYGYYIYDSGDIDYDDAPIYDWIEIAEGQGSQVSITDAGNGNSNYTSSTNSRILPFPFNFYGQEYNSIQINTNGWISFGDYQMNAFRNYPIPGAGGPSPMVAAFWDDLMTGSGGNVYYYESNEYVVVQWDDMRTCGNLSGGWYATNCSGGPRQTFQIILYPTNEIKIQYQDFNNASDGNYPSGGTPSHGCYSTVGIENHLGNIGLQYTFNNSYPAAAMELQDGSALFITDGTNFDFILGDINNDNLLDVLDVVGLVNAVLISEYSEIADMNSDEILDILDIISLINIILF